jgi:hypothetical protein
MNQADSRSTLFPRFGASFANMIGAFRGNANVMRWKHYGPSLSRVARILRQTEMQATEREGLE